MFDKGYFQSTASSVYNFADRESNLSSGNNINTKSNNPFYQNHISPSKIKEYINKSTKLNN